MSSVISEPGDVQPQDSSSIVLAPYFTCSTLKLTVMSICTVGLYGMYWFFVNWLVIKQHIGDSDGKKIRPFWRALFSVFWAYGCFKHIRDDSRKRGLESGLPIISLALGYLVFTVVLRLPDPLWLLFYLNFTVVVPVNTLAIMINKNTRPDFENNSKFNLKNLFVIFFGGSVFISNIIYAINPGLIPS